MADKAINWDKIKTEYMITDTTYAKLAKKWKISVQAVNKKAADDLWTDARKLFKKTVEEKLINKAAESESDKLSKLYSAADGILSVLSGFMQEQANFIDNEKGKPNFSDLRTAVNIIDKATDTMRKLYGLRSIEQQDSKEIELAKIRGEAARQLQAESNGEAGVILLPEMLVEAHE